jgi:hypothetical protein
MGGHCAEVCHLARCKPPIAGSWTPSGQQGSISDWAQCGGRGGNCASYGSCDDGAYKGSGCASGSSCVRINEWYYQCQPGGGSGSASSRRLVCAASLDSETASGKSHLAIHCFHWATQLRILPSLPDQHNNCRRRPALQLLWQHKGGDPPQRGAAQGPGAGLLQGAPRRGRHAAGDTRRHRRRAALDLPCKREVCWLVWAATGSAAQQFDRAAAQVVPTCRS